MSMEIIGASTPYAAPQTPQKPQGNEEITTVTTKCMYGKTRKLCQREVALR